MTITTYKDIPTSYSDLVAWHMPRTIHDKADFENASAIVDAMAGFQLNEDQEDYLGTISTLIETYENELLKEKRTRGPRGLPVLQYLCEENGINGAGLADILNVSRQQGYNLLKGERQLNPSNMSKLSKRFKVDPSLFIAE